MSKLFIWDLDGTLIDSLPTTFAAINDGIEHLTRRRLEPHEIFAHFGGPEIDVVSKIVGPKHAEECHRRMVTSLERRLLEIRPFEGIISILSLLKSLDARLAIFTGRSRRTTDIVLSHLEMAGYFSCVIAGDEVMRHKPHPDGIHEICEKLGESPSDAVMIGDHPYDIMAGNAAGLGRTIGCEWGGIATREALLAAKPSCLAENPRQLEALLTAR